MLPRYILNMNCKLSHLYNALHERQHHASSEMHSAQYFCETLAVSNTQKRAD